MDRTRASLMRPLTMEDVVERIGRMKPRILFVNLDQSTGADFALLEALHRNAPRRSSCC